MLDGWIRLEDSGGVLWKHSSSNNHASVDNGMIQWVYLEDSKIGVMFHRTKELCQER